MKATVLTLAAVASVTGLASGVPAAERGQPSEIFIHARYFHCSQINVREADEAVAALYKAELDDLVKEGKVGSWGWLVKKTGGEWSRAGYLTASSVQEVLQAGDEVSIRSDWRFPVRAFATACGSSEDYIWHVLSGNDARGHRGKAALSTYYACDQSREAKVNSLAKLDALVKSELAPKYDRLVAAGRLTSWAWAEEALGGRYQRLATMSASTVEALIAAREDMARAVSAVCSSHQDYIWEVQDQGP